LTDFELLDFKVTDIVSHVDLTKNDTMNLGTEYRMATRTPEPADGTLCVYLNVKVSAENEEDFLLDVTTATVLNLPEGCLDMTDEIAPKCVEISQKETHKAIKSLTESMGMTPMDLDA